MSLNALKQFHSIIGSANVTFSVMLKDMVIVEQLYAVYSTPMLAWFSKLPAL